MTEILDGQASLFDPDIWSGRTYPEPSAAETQKAATSQPSLRKSSKSANRAAMCVCVCRTKDGPTPGAITLTMGAGALLGEFTTHSFGESPREENVSRLSQILEDSAHQRFSLSARACQGILNRAARRGKELPPELKAALEEQPVSRNEPVNLGGGKGLLLQHEHTGALSTLNNQSVYNGVQHTRGGVTSQNSQGFGIKKDVQFTLNAVDIHGVAAVDCRNGTENKCVNGTLQAKEQGQNLNSNNVVRVANVTGF